MRRLSFAVPTVLLAVVAGASMPARAQEPLLLHIRPNNAPLPEDARAGERLSDAELAARAMAAREAVWQRAERRARIAIASVCTGCLPAAPPAEATRLATPSAAPIRAAEASLPESSLPDPRPPTEGDL